MSRQMVRDWTGSRSDRADKVIGNTNFSWAGKIWCVVTGIKKKERKETKTWQALTQCGVLTILKLKRLILRVFALKVRGDMQKRATGLAEHGAVPCDEIKRN